MLCNGIKILVIDDDIGIIDMISDYLGEKYSIKGCTNSKDGLELVKNGDFDILVLDYYIDQLNGMDVIKKIRTFNSDIHILLLTGYAGDIPPLKTLEELDIQAYCEKSSDFEKIITFIESIIKTIDFIREKKSTIGQRIKSLRKTYKMSQDDLAKHLGIERSTITQYELGKNTPQAATIIKLAELFNVTTDYILCHELKVK